jgi:hypothetical protein
MRRSGVFWGLILVLAGVLFLLDSLNILDINIWGILWPLFLIILGAWFLMGTFFRRSIKTEHANLPLDGAARANVRVLHAAGRLKVGSGAGQGDLLIGDFGGGLDLRSHHIGDLLEATLSMPAQMFPFFDWPGGNLDWSFNLARDIPLSLDLETGANEAHVDLTDLVVNDIRIQSGASSTEVTFPARAGLTRARIGAGAASIQLNVPPGVAALIRTRGGLSSIRVDESRFPRMGDTYRSLDYDSALNKLDLEIEMGVGSVEIR